MKDRPARPDEADSDLGADHPLHWPPSSHSEQPEVALFTVRPKATAGGSVIDVRNASRVDLDEVPLPETPPHQRGSAGSGDFGNDFATLDTLGTADALADDGGANGAGPQPTLRPNRPKRRLTRPQVRTATDDLVDALLKDTELARAFPGVLDTDLPAASPVADDSAQPVMESAPAASHHVAQPPEETRANEPAAEDLPDLALFAQPAGGTSQPDYDPFAVGNLDDFPSESNTPAATTQAWAEEAPIASSASGDTSELRFFEAEPAAAPATTTPPIAIGADRTEAPKARSGTSPAGAIPPSSPPVARVPEPRAERPAVGAVVSGATAPKIAAAPKSAAAPTPATAPPTVTTAPKTAAGAKSSDRSTPAPPSKPRSRGTSVERTPAAAAPALASAAVGPATAPTAHVAGRKHRPLPIVIGLTAAAAVLAAIGIARVSEAPWIDQPEQQVASTTPVGATTVAPPSPEPPALGTSGSPGADTGNRVSAGAPSANVAVDPPPAAAPSASATSSGTAARENSAPPIGPSGARAAAAATPPERRADNTGAAESARDTRSVATAKRENTPAPTNRPENTATASRDRAGEVAPPTTATRTPPPPVPSTAVPPPAPAAESARTGIPAGASAAGSEAGTGVAAPGESPGSAPARRDDEGTPIARADARRPDPTAADTSRVEPAKPDGARPETPAPDAPRPETAKPVEAARGDATASAPSASASGASAAAASDAISSTLKDLQHAYSQRDATLVKAVWPTVNERALGRAFDGLRSQTVTFDRCQVNVNGAAGEVACRGVTTYVPRVGAQYPRTESRQWTFRVQKNDERWLITSAAAR